MSAIVLDHGRIAAADSAVAISRSPRPPVARNNALMDAIFRNLTRFFAFLVFSLLAAILVSLAIGAPRGGRRGAGWPGAALCGPLAEAIARAPQPTERTVPRAPRPPHRAGRRVSRRAPHPAAPPPPARGPGGYGAGVRVFMQGSAD